MRKIVLIAGLFTFLTVQAYSQNTQPSESQQLSRQIGALYQQGKFDEAIPLAEKVVEIEKKSAKNSEGHAIALLNLAMLHKERMRRLKIQFDASNVPDMAKANRTISDDIKGAEDMMRDSLKIYQQLSMGESLPVASLKYELAWVLSNHRSYAFMPVNVKEKIDEAEKLYTEALATQEKGAGNDSDMTLRTVLAFGDFYTRWINFEKALPFYERYIAAYEKKPEAARALVPALRGMIEIFVITDQQPKAGELAKKIEAITGRTESLPATYPNLALRAKKIEKVDNNKFILPEKANDISFIFSTASAARATSLMGGFRANQVIVNIVVDENGDVTEARVDRDIKTKPEIENAAMRSKFRPFSYKGEARKMRGSIMYSYVD